MTRRIRSVLLGLTALLSLMAGACSSCSFHTYTAADNQTRKPSTTTTTPAASSRELLDDEDAGGHTLARHVAKSDDELRDRLMHERVSAASTYTDHATAERAVGAALAANHDRIEQWLSSTGGHPNLVLDYDSPQPIGRTLRRGETTSTPCSHALVVLEWQPPANYFVLTSYPECK